MPDDAVLRALAEARALGFLGPGPLTAHVTSAEAFAGALAGVEGAVLDLGAGGGVPGLLLASRFPALQWTLLDVQRRRTSFLSRVVIDLCLQERVEVLHADACEAARDDRWRERFAAVTARSFGPPAVTAESAVGFLRSGGRLVVADPRQAGDRWPAPGLAALGLSVAPDHSPGVCVLQRSGALAAGTPRPRRKVLAHPCW